tara:strand:- start:849 stop:1064 length:216 start_codon:yes stop_codon:yes gene_type:complete
LIVLSPLANFFGSTCDLVSFFVYTVAFLIADCSFGEFLISFTTAVTFYWVIGAYLVTFCLIYTGLIILEET